MQLLLLLAVASANPITKVLTLLEDLQKKVLLDGEIEQKQYEKFAEWCEDNAVKTQYMIKNAKAKVEDLSAVIEKEGAKIVDADSTIHDLAKQIGRNDRDLKAATEIRDKEKADFEAADTELADTIDMIGRAIGILEKNLKGQSFAQVAGKFQGLMDALNVVLRASAFNDQDKSKLQALVQTEDGDDDDFLSKSAPAAKAYESQSGGIIETLEDMKDKAVAMRNDGQKSEMSAQHSYNMLAQSLKDALKVDNKALDEAKGDKATAAETKSIAEGDLTRTQQTLKESEKALGELAADCQQKAADWNLSQKSRAEELQALTDARRIIGEKTGGATDQAYGLLEVHTASGGVVPQIVQNLKALGQKSGDVAMTQLALRVEAATQMDSSADIFAKVRQMIQGLVDKLVADAAEEADHKAWCDKETKESREKIEDHTSAIEKYTARVDKAEAAIAQLTEEIAKTTAFLHDLVKQQAEMDTMRAEQKATFQKAKKDYTDGIEGLTMALQVLREYYASGSGDAEALDQQPTVGTHSAASGAATGIIGLLEVAQSDFTKLLADSEAEENAAQSEYDRVTHENNVNKAMKEADNKYNAKEKASLAKKVAEAKEDREGEQAELDAVNEYFAQIRPGCTTKPMTYEERKARRESEIAGLKEALTILEQTAAAPAEESFLQVRRR